MRTALDVKELRFKETIQRLREAMEAYQGLNNVTYDEFAAGRINALQNATDFRVVATSTSSGGDAPQAFLDRGQSRCRESSWW